MKKKALYNSISPQYTLVIYILQIENQKKLTTSNHFATCKFEVMCYVNGKKYNKTTDHVTNLGVSNILSRDTP